MDAIRSLRVMDVTDSRRRQGEVFLNSGHVSRMKDIETGDSRPHEAHAKLTLDGPILREAVRERRIEPCAPTRPHRPWS